MYVEITILELVQAFDSQVTCAIDIFFTLCSIQIGKKIQLKRI